MRATHFHLSTDVRRRVFDVRHLPGAVAWRAARALAHDGATVIVGGAPGRERLQAFESLLSDRGLGDLVIQRGSEAHGLLVESAAEIPTELSAAPVELVEVPDSSHGPDIEYQDESAVGRVSLVGGGPGDPSLLTLQALTEIAHADVIFLDRLGIALEALDLAPGAIIVDVGKSPGRHRLAQERINEEMYQLAAAGAHVVRLKGGDVFIFGRGGEEWRYLAERSIPVDIVPGVTSALAVPAHAGISATLRHVTRTVTIISAHEVLSEKEARGLVDLGGTIMILMGVATFESTVSSLLEAGMSPETGVALIEQGFTPHERHTMTSLGTAVEDARARAVKNPAIIAIGEVVNRREPTAALDQP